MRLYPSATIERFTGSYQDGAYTYDQVEAMFSHVMKALNEDYKFQASLHGIDTSKESDGLMKDGEVPEGTKRNEFIFGDPAAYDKMSQEEREELTKNMMGNWVSFTQNSSGIGGING